MDNDFFLNAGIPPPMPTWADPPFHSDQSHDCFINPYWDKSADQTLQFDSAFSFMVSSPAASNSNVPGDSFLGRELIGRLGNIRSSGEISPVARPLLAVSSFVSGCGNSSANASCYSIPLSSPPKPNLPAELHKGSPLLSSSVDPGFAERAARFSCFGSRSFNGRTSHLGLDNNVTGHGSKTNHLLGNSKLPRVSSSPSLKALALVRNSSFQHRPEMANSQDESTVSEANLNGNSGFKTTNDLNPRKRKAASKGKTKNAATGNSANATKVPDANEDSNSKKYKQNEGNGSENASVKTEEEAGRDEKQSKNTKPPEPPKDYIHVRARRGQATDSHSLAERVRREKISERMKLLQDLVPGCNKVTGKALMLDEIINYVQSLQRQVEFLSMKLASVNTRLDINMDTLMSKDIFQHNSSLSQPIFPATSTFFDHQVQIQNSHQNPALSNATITQCSSSSATEPLSHLPPLHHFNASVPSVQCPAYYEGDLQTIVQMGIGQNQDPEHDFHGSNQVSHMKVEL